jgi:hypothetical protein
LMKMSLRRERRAAKVIAGVVESVRRERAAHVARCGLSRERATRAA